jgi:Protein of unknown function (DUF2897)
MKALIIIMIVLGALVGLLLTLRSSARTGMPSEDVINRAKQREKELQASEKKEDD